MGSLAGLDGLRVARRRHAAEDGRLQEDYFRHTDVLKTAVRYSIHKDMLDWSLADGVAMPDDGDIYDTVLDGVFYIRLGKDAAENPRVAVVSGSRAVASSMYAMNIVSCVGLGIPAYRPICIASREGTTMGSCLRRLARCQVEWHMPACMRVLSRDYVLLSELAPGCPLGKLGQADGMELL